MQCQNKQAITQIHKAMTTLKNLTYAELNEVLTAVLAEIETRKAVAEIETRKAVAEIAATEVTATPDPKPEVVEAPAPVVLYDYIFDGDGRKAAYPATKKQYDYLRSFKNVTIECSTSKFFKFISSESASAAIEVAKKGAIVLIIE